MATTPAVAHRIRTAGRGTAAAPASAPPTRLREATRMPLPKPSYADPGSPPARRRSAAWEVVRHRASRIWQQNLLGCCRPLEGLFRPTSPPDLPLLHTAFNDPDTGRHPPEFSFVVVPDAVPESAVGGIAKILALNAAMEASGHVRGALASLLAAEGEPRLACLVIDSTLTGAQKAAPSLGLPTVVLHTGNTTCFRLFRSYDMLQDKGYLPATG